VDPDEVFITSDIDDLVITLSDRFASIEGRIRAAGGTEAPSRFLVTLTSANGQDAETRPTDQNGGFLFDRLVPGDYRICARASDAPHDASCALERALTIEAGDEMELALTLPQ
jgi:hypothetical protein